jgi:energy-coupling factor transport system ATP-binding protein
MMIKIENVTFSYPGAAHQALKNLSLSVGAGEFILVAGPSGSGKSTFLRCLNGLVPHFSGGSVSGRVLVNGLDTVASGPQALSPHVGFVGQSPESQSVLDVVEPEIAFGLENAAVPRQQMRLRVEEVLDCLDLIPVRDRQLNTLSGGERQKVAIASALAFRPQILVLDEPTSQLDPQAAEEVLQALVRLNEDLGLTIVLAEHRLERVLRYADRVLYLDDGYIVVDAAARDAALLMPQLPPLAALGRALSWDPLPLTVKEAQRFARPLNGSLGTHRYGSPDGDASGAPLPHVIKANDLGYAYNGHPALTGVSLSIGSGEAVALMGRNGSGKSTLLKCLVGLLKPDSGAVILNGQSNAGKDVADICRDVAYLPQNPDDLLFADSVAAELEITMSNHDIVGRTNHSFQLLAELGLGELSEHYPRDLSVGQRQRVALGAVTVTEPRLILLDEPTRGLDNEAKRSLVALWRKWLDRGVGLLLVTHDVELAAMIADRVLLMSQGKLIAEGPTSAILGATPLFAPQIAKLFPGRGWLTVEDALKGLAVSSQIDLPQAH